VYSAFTLQPILDGPAEHLTTRLVLAFDELVQSDLLLLGEGPSLVVGTADLASPISGGLVQFLLIILEGTNSQDCDVVLLCCLSCCRNQRMWGYTAGPKQELSYISTSKLLQTAAHSTAVQQQQQQ